VNTKMLATEWIQQDEQNQRDEFARTGKKPRSKAPDRSLFASEEEYNAAIQGQKFLCDKDEHEGERVLEPGQYNNKGAKTCKQCKARKTASNRPPPIVYTTAEEWFEANANKTSEKHPTLTVGYCPKPKPEKFTTELEYERAKVMEKQNNDEFHKQIRKLESVKERNNETARERYAEKKETEEGKEELEQKKKRDTANKKARLEAPVPEGMGKCHIGPHNVPLADLKYDPAVDLGITDYGGDRGRDIVRKFCKKHFHGNVMKYRRHNEKPESIIKSTKYQAEQDGVAYNLTIEEEADLFFYGNECYFCGYSSNTECIGLNRIDISKKEISKDNVIIACDCKKSRMGMPIPDFIKACSNIVNYQFHAIKNTQMVVYVQGPSRVSHQGSSFSAHRRAATAKGIPHELTEEDYVKLQNSECYLCGIQGDIGIDRKDSEIGYTKDNSYPCCSACNYMKKTDPTNLVLNGELLQSFMTSG
jgi:hypothetical protein